MVKREDMRWEIIDEVTKRLQGSIMGAYIKREKVDTSSDDAQLPLKTSNQFSPYLKSNIPNRLPKIHIRMFHEFTYDPNTDTRVDIKGPFMNVVTPGKQLKYPNRGKKAKKGEEAEIVEDEVI